MAMNSSEGSRLPEMGIEKRPKIKKIDYMNMEHGVHGMRGRGRILRKCWKCRDEFEGAITGSPYCKKHRRKYPYVLGGNYGVNRKRKRKKRHKGKR